MEKNQNDPAKDRSSKDQEEAAREVYRKWEDPKQNKMGNDISSEIKIANSGGKREGGVDNEWHMDENSKKGDEEAKQESAQ
ncbi:MAG TPA: hypothetical protein VM012_00650 [Flavitalea sp.]|nr:hypothetical protein [Flavitalea sp.]